MFRSSKVHSSRIVILTKHFYLNLFYLVLLCVVFIISKDMDYYPSYFEASLTT